MLKEKSKRAINKKEKDSETSYIKRAINKKDRGIEQKEKGDRQNRKKNIKR